MAEETWLARAIELAVDNVAEGGRPFGAVVVRDGAVVATGVNRALQEDDPTAHAELLAIRAAGRTLGSISLAGCVVYASGEPCPMCQAAAALAGVERIVFAAPASLAEEVGLSTAAVAAELRLPASERQVVPLEHHPLAEAERPFAAYAERLREAESA
jgi:tRNA(Arg) A34 adenosine deaminase TadA